jgi:hypothetical protein
MNGSNCGTCTDDCGNSIDCDDWTPCGPCENSTTGCYNPDGTASYCTQSTAIAVNTGGVNPCPAGCNCDGNGNVLGCPGNTSLGNAGGAVTSGQSTTIGGQAVGVTGTVLANIGALLGGLSKGLGLTQGQPTRTTVNQTPPVNTNPLSSGGLWIVVGIVAVLTVWEWKRNQ